MKGGRRLHEEDFGLFYEETAPALQVYARGLVGSTDESQDLVQETYVRFLEKAPSSLTSRQRVSWLYTTVTRLARESWRRRDRAAGWAARSPAPESVKPSEIGTRDLERALARLTVRDRALLLLAYVEGWSHREIAPILGVGKRSVRVLLYRARRRLEAALEDLGVGKEVLDET